MNVISWNMRRAKKESEAWSCLREENPDIALLQEVGEIPEDISQSYSLVMKKPRKKDGGEQSFYTAILVRGEINYEIQLTVKESWLAESMEYFEGNFIALNISTKEFESINIASIYSPAWRIDTGLIPALESSQMGMEKTPGLMFYDIFFKAIQNQDFMSTEWIIAGDLNTSLKFEELYGWTNCRHLIRGLEEMGLHECLKGFNDEIVPTFKHSRGSVIHQLDYMFVTQSLRECLSSCSTGDDKILTESFSDHLPIISKFIPQ
jgi:exonuclease III